MSIHWEDHMKDAPHKMLKEREETLSAAKKAFMEERTLARLVVSFGRRWIIMQRSPKPGCLQ